MKIKKSNVKSNLTVKLEKPQYWSGDVIKGSLQRWPLVICPTTVVSVELICEVKLSPPWSFTQTNELKLVEPQIIMDCHHAADGSLKSRLRGGSLTGPVEITFALQIPKIPIPSTATSLELRRASLTVRHFLKFTFMNYARKQLGTLEHDVKILCVRNFDLPDAPQRIRQITPFREEIRNFLWTMYSERMGNLMVSLTLDKTVYGPGDTLKYIVSFEAEDERAYLLLHMKRVSVAVVQIVGHGAKHSLVAPLTETYLTRKGVDGSFQLPRVDHGLLTTYEGVRGQISMHHEVRVLLHPVNVSAASSEVLASLSFTVIGASLAEYQGIDIRYTEVPVTARQQRDQATFVQFKETEQELVKENKAHYDGAMHSVMRLSSVSTEAPSVAPSFSNEPPSPTAGLPRVDRALTDDSIDLHR